ncbi:MAG: GxxExxY protein [Candidatus Omnitrophica bacterium]|nr:GxxExxY protein [Candidatus Omnitrophota bacterium]
MDDGLYKDLTYKVIGLLYEVHGELGPVHKENIYANAIAIELESNGINFEREKQIAVKYKDRQVGAYRPDFIIEDKVVLEIKAVPVLTKSMIDQMYYYLKGSGYKLVLLANFGTKNLAVKRRIYT